MSDGIFALPASYQVGTGERPEGKGLGRLVSDDSRDFQFLLRRALPERSELEYRYWNQSQWWGDQGSTPHCVAYAWLHWLEDGPVTHKDRPAPYLNPRLFYCEAQKVDEWQGDCSNPRYDGTSIRAGAKHLQSLGLIGAYRWGYDLDTLVQALLTTGPVVMGTWWYESMFYPKSDGVAEVSGDRVGGHAYLANGVNTESELIRFKNSWGRSWGRHGNFWMSFDDVERLIHEQGEICIGTELSQTDKD